MLEILNTRSFIMSVIFFNILLIHLLTFVIFFSFRILFLIMKLLLFFDTEVYNLFEIPLHTKALNVNND